MSPDPFVGRSLLNACRHDMRVHLKQLVLTDIVYKVIAFVVLTPLAGIVFRFFVAISGKSVLADEDILFFFLSPIGWVSLVVAGAVWIAVSVLELAALMIIVAEATSEQRTDVVWALRRSAMHAWPILRVTARIVLLVLLAVAPFAAAAGLVYAALLTRYDINFYLTEKPPTFWVAVALGSVIAACLLAALLRLATSWLFVFPCLLFQQSAPRETLRISRQKATGHRKTLGAWIAAWAIGCSALSALGTGIVGLVGSVLLTSTKGPLSLLVLLVGVVLVTWSLVNFVVTVLSDTTLAVLLVNLYRERVGDSGFRTPRLEVAQSSSAIARFKLSGRALLGWTAVAAIVAGIAGFSVLRSVKLEDRTEITAHRGASGAAPENTLAAVERAISDGAHWVEIDVQESADGVVLVVHDSDLKRIGGADLKIWEATAAELQKVDIGSWFAREFRDQRVPTLDEVLTMCKKGKIRVNIELKYYGHDQQLEQSVVDLVEAHGMQSDVVIMSLKKEGIRKAKSLGSQWKVGLLTAVAVGDLTRVDADFLAVSTNLATRSFVRAAHGSGKEVYVWTVNDPVTMSIMIGRGVDSIITDKPAMGRSVLKQRAGMSSVDRLLLEVAGLLGAMPESKLTIDDV